MLAERFSGDLHFEKALEERLDAALTSSGSMSTFVRACVAHDADGTGRVAKGKRSAVRLLLSPAVTKKVITAKLLDNYPNEFVFLLSEFWKLWADEASVISGVVGDSERCFSMATSRTPLHTVAARGSSNVANILLNEKWMNADKVDKVDEVRSSAGLALWRFVFFLISLHALCPHDSAA